MYARSSAGDVYHLLKNDDEEKTLCGLGVVPIIIDRPVNVGSLHLTSKRPTDRELCADCAEIEREKKKSK
jgi:hypothetical protein